MSNGKMPWGKFYWSDWDRDVALASCSLAAQGAWMRLLCAMQEQDTYEVRGSVDNFARILRCSGPEAAEAIDELAVTGAADLYAFKPRGRPQQVPNINDDLSGFYSVTCRRLKRECNARETVRKRVQRHRLAKEKRSRNGSETDLKRECNRLESESESDPEKKRAMLARAVAVGDVSHGAREGGSADQAPDGAARASGISGAESQNGTGADRAGSRFTLDQIERYVETLDDVRNARGLAVSIKRSGVDDDRIAAFLNGGSICKTHQQLTEERNARIFRRIQDRRATRDN